MHGPRETSTPGKLTSSWDDYLTAVFGVDSNSSHVTTTSYEFDYYNSCHDRDSYYNGAFYSSGGIPNCPHT